MTPVGTISSVMRRNPTPGTTMMNKKPYASGMYGGKFMPMHRGHLNCLRKASELCDRVYLIMFYGGDDEERIRRSDGREFLSVENRWSQVKRAASQFDNVTPFMLDISDCRFEDGSEDWDKETPRVISAIGHFDAVFGSEPSYKAYFDRAYPWAEYIMVDPERKELPISATKIRNMETEEEIRKWIV